jgi:hypothetical protein
MTTRIPFLGVLLDQQTITAFLAAERMAGFPLEIMQGSWSTGVSASAGTHAGGGALDVSLRDAAGNLRPDLEQVRIVWAMRRAGLRTWRRTPAQGFPYHAHGIMSGDPLVSPAAASQLVQWNAGQNGLADHGPDDDPINVAAGRPAVLAPGAAVSRTMYDAVTVANIPAGASMVAGYVDGTYANMAAMTARFPNAVHVPIAVRASTNAGLVLDVETGDATPAQSVGWVVMRRAAGVDPSVYCNTSTWPAVKAAFSSAGVAPPHYWVAQYDGNPTVPAGAVAKQYSNPGPYDVSSVADVWPGVDTGAPDVAMTLDDAKMFVSVLFNSTFPDLQLPDPANPGKFLNSNVVSVLEYSNKWYTLIMNRIAEAEAKTDAQTAQLAALSAKMDALLAMDGPTAAQVSAGMAEAFVELGHKLDGTPTA